MTYTVAPICMRCAHYDEDSRVGGKLTCAAFPAGIPVEILNSKADHREPYHGDNGVRFELQDGSAPPPFDLLFPPNS